MATMYDEETNHVYKELDLIRLVYEDGKLIGLYRPAEVEDGGAE